MPDWELAIFDPLTMPENLKIVSDGQDGRLRSGQVYLGSN